MPAELRLGDNLALLRAIPKTSIDLVYLDPPFFTQRTHTAARGSFDDNWASRDEFVASIRARIVELRRVLNPTGALYLHADPNHASHPLKIMLDDVFGPCCYLGEIVWQRTHAHSSARKKFAPIHDVILAYERCQGQHDLRAEHDSMWLDIIGLNQMAKERAGYPTQKPLALLERIITASSRPGDVVLDPYCGSGTTLVAAEQLGRDSIGFDASEEAITVARERLDAIVPTLRLAS